MRQFGMGMRQFRMGMRFLELECEVLTVLSEPEEEIGILKIMLVYDMVDIIRIH